VSNRLAGRLLPKVSCGLAMSIAAFMLLPVAAALAAPTLSVAVVRHAVVDAMHEYGSHSYVFGCGSYSKSSVGCDVGRTHKGKLCVWTIGASEKRVRGKWTVVYSVWDEPVCAQNKRLSVAAGENAVSNWLTAATDSVQILGCTPAYLGTRVDCTVLSTDSLCAGNAWAYWENGRIKVTMDDADCKSWPFG